VWAPTRPESIVYRLHSLRHALNWRRQRARVEEIFQRTLLSVDRRAFADALRPYWSPVPTNGPEKYLDVNVWLRQAAFRYLQTRLPAAPAGRRVLDLGSGPGYFPLVCRGEGHHPLALDLDDEPLYGELVRFFGLPRHVHRIEPMRPLPDLGAPFDAITAFRTCFNVKADGRPWETEEWAFFLSDLRQRLEPGGEVVLCFNVNRATGEFYSSPVARLFTTRRDFDARLFFEYAFLKAK
jgi:SAM-dependent methyltransferase